MTMLQTFLDELRTLAIEDLMNDFIDTFESDSSGWVVVDGEEGDHGQILYRHNGVLVAKMVSSGGDTDYYEFTPEGKDILLSKYLSIIFKQNDVVRSSQPTAGIAS